ncbi:unnamed protein product [Dovyalis caffra]|uniref:Neprosin PEP catalytic domain-containing protein n=1 Tax=Dovyalis caffra TaxID=77055 RepID=A0AAV1SGD9_9ROSI|nr:unnamed protein product [Dovyalis caffra]
MGAYIATMSAYGGPQWDIIMLVWKDPRSGNWWLQFGQEVVGYWPGSLFLHLNDSATNIEWGGEILNSKVGGKHTTTQMGSGHFPPEGFGKAGYFRNIQVVDGSKKLQEPTNIALLFPNPNAMISKQANWVIGTITYILGLLAEALEENQAMALSFDLQDFILRARVLKLYRQALRTTRRAPDGARADLKQTIRQEMENSRNCNDKQRIRFLISEGLERLKRLDETLDMQGHS